MHRNIITHNLTIRLCIYVYNYVNKTSPKTFSVGRIIIIVLFFFSIKNLNNYRQKRNFNEKTGGAEALLYFSCSSMVVDTRNPYNSIATKIYLVNN
jgi:hypothetical protein